MSLMFKRILLPVLFLLTIARPIAGSALPPKPPQSQGVSFLDYYHGNKELGIKPHEKEIGAQVAIGRLYLNGKNLTDLDGIETVPGIDRIVALFVNNNQLKSLPESMSQLAHVQEFEAENNLFIAFPEAITLMPDLRVLSLAHNFIRDPLTDAPLNAVRLAALQSLDLSYNEIATVPKVINGLGTATKINLTNNPLMLDSRAQALVDALHAGDLKKVKDIFANIIFDNAAGRHIVNFGKVMGLEFLHKPLMRKLEISKIRDQLGNNLLHIAVNEAGARVKEMRDALSEVRNDIELSEKDRAEVTDSLSKRIDEINDRYMKILAVLFECGDECVQEMLWMPNARGEAVVYSILRQLGPSSPIFRAITLAGEEDNEEQERKGGEQPQARQTFSRRFQAFLKQHRKK